MLTLIDSVGYGDSTELDTWKDHITKYLEGNVRKAHFVSTLFIIVGGLL